ncbi:discoidin domain-containing protein [Paraburkholderia rhizosphaerae]|uniref:Glycosyl hydrolase family 2 n=1 Tax=Paraburkholderia rhizosphaerae TaxID=480658 RepID=A0A4R8LX94_9BURK|nr:discoidin domain-containing protein [Paraburkholderia rhizosphaerae]TDY51435.1 glycosyl hydrolase family 2 [Paraburkholderia rhizosphaerae]
MRERIGHLSGQLAGQLALLWLLLVFATHAVAGVSIPASNRIDINLGQTPWRYIKDSDGAVGADGVPEYAKRDYDDSDPAKGWQDKGVPQSPSDNDTFLNKESGGGEGQLTGNITWYRKHFKLDPAYKDRKVLIEFEGAHVGAQVYINGKFIQGNSEIPENKNATHVMGFIPFEVDATDFVTFDGTTDNVIAVKVARNDKFFKSPGFGGAFRFGQSDSGLFRPVWMHITDRVRIPENVYAVMHTWGTYVSTAALTASGDSASILVRTNVLNENSTDQQVTLTTQIVDANGQVVARRQDTQKVEVSGTAPNLKEQVFDQTLTVSNPTLWYPNNSTYGKPYLYHVITTVAVDGVVKDAKDTPLGIRTITWDSNFPIINGHPHYLWGASGRYDFPALGSAVPAALQWRDLMLLADAGGSLYRPGHSAQGPEFLDAADAYGVMVLQPSGDGENGFAHICTDDAQTNCMQSWDRDLKKELHRDMIVHDRNRPSVLAWEADNGATDTDFARLLKGISQTWDPTHTRAQADRTPNPDNGDLLGCSGNGCDIGVKHQFPNSPSVGSEYWGTGVGRASYDYEIQFAESYVKQWVQSVAIKSMGIAHWYLADTPGEIVDQFDHYSNMEVRSNGASMMDENRLPRLLYYIYQEAWTPYEIKPVVKLAYHWTRVPTNDDPSLEKVRVNAFSNCPLVRLTLNGQQVGEVQTPNSKETYSNADASQQTTQLPGQVHWDNVKFVPGTLRAECLNQRSEVVTYDQQVTAGNEDHIRLTVEPQLTKPDGTQFPLVANGTDAAIIHVEVVDANGVVVPISEKQKREITFAVNGAAGEYRGGSDHYYDDSQPLGWHAPGDTKLYVQGGVTQIVVRSTFTPGTVTVTATSPGLGSGTATYTVAPIDAAQVFDGKSLIIGAQQGTPPQIITQPINQNSTVGLTATFNVLAASSAQLSFQWMKNGAPIPGANSFAYTTPALTVDDDGAKYSVTVSNVNGSQTSDAAVLSVVQPKKPEITTQPSPVTITAGNSTQFSVIASGSPVLSYQWLKNGVTITGANQNEYATPIETLADDGAQFSVIVTNSAGSATSNSATLTVSNAIAPAIVAQPRSQSVTLGQNVTLSVQASGSAPLTYQWKLNGEPITANSTATSSDYVIKSATDTDNGDYQVTVSNAGGSVTSDIAKLVVSGGGASNLALGAATASGSVSGEKEETGPAFAVDGSLGTRWSSAFDDTAWIMVDLGEVRTFDQIVLAWENAYADKYRIEVSNDVGPAPANKQWTTIYTQDTGTGGTETIRFNSTSARYVRMQGVTRHTAYGYSLWEFGVYDVPQCSAQSTTERFTPIPAKPGTWTSPIDGLESGPFIATVQDNVSGLTWQQFDTTFQTKGAQFVQSIADQYCKSLGMRLPTLNEALTIARANYASCAFPAGWDTWTTTDVPSVEGNAYIVNQAGKLSFAIKNNNPGWALCVSGPTAAAPVIVSQPASQTVGVGQSATFKVGIDPKGTGPFSYQWFKVGSQDPIFISTIPSFTTQSLTTADNGSYYVTISNGGGTVTSAQATLTVTAGGGGNPNPDPDPNPNPNPNPNPENPDDPNGHPDNGGNPIPSGNLALASGVKAYATSRENDGYYATKAIDGNDGTRWSSKFADDQSLIVDLGSAQKFDRAVLRWQDSYALVYDIDVSNDESTDPNAKNWTTVYTQKAGKGGTEDVRFTLSEPARYVRMHGKTRSTQFGFSLFEFGIYNTANTPSYTITATSTGSGTITATGNSTTTSDGKTTVLQGAPQSYVFTPADGAAVTGVVVDGKAIGMVNSYSFDDVLANHTISVTFGPASAAVNLALGAKVSATSYEGVPNDEGKPAPYPAEAAVDGKMDTRWSSGPFDLTYFTIDFQKATTFNHLVLFWQDAHATKYEIETSNDNGNTWTSVYTQADSKGGVESITLDTPVTAQLVRMHGEGRSTGYGYSLYEFQVFNVTADNSGNGGTTNPGTGTGDNGGTTDPGTGTDNSGSTGGGSDETQPTQPQQPGGHAAQPVSANLALGKPAITTGVQGDGYPATAAVDGDQNSRWSSDQKDDASLEVDLQQAVPFNRVVLRWENAYGKQYLIQTSNDEKTWNTVFTQSAGKGGTEDISLPTTTARYIRMQGVQRATQYGYSLFEFEVYNTAAASKLTITASGDANGALSPSGAVSVEPGASQTFTAVPASGYGVGAMTVDGQLLGAQSTYTFNNVSAAHTISVKFVPLAASVNLALHKAVSVSGVENNNVPGTAAVDGDLNTRWSSSFVDPSYLMVDLGAQQTFDRVVMNWENAHAAAYEIQWSNDVGQDPMDATTKNWTTVYKQDASKGGVEDVKFQAPVTARFVRMYSTARSTPYGNSLFEFGVYNSGASTSTPPVSAFIQQPANQSVPAGQNGHFATMMSGSGPFTYQWRRNGAAIAGATSRTYDTPATAAGDNGAVYSVVVTGPNGASTSNDAKLSVDTSVPNYTVKPGFIGIDLVNNTNGAYTDDQVYVLVIARDPATGQFAWLKPDGTIVASAVSDNDAANHLTGPDGKNYSNYAFTLAQSKTLQLPKLFSGRLYVSLGSPVFLKILNDANNNIGFAGPNPQNGTDPNLNVNFDWYEFTYGDNGLWMNTTQVDEFGFPMTQDVYGSNRTFHMRTGISQRRADLFAAYASEVSSAFQPQSKSQFRIMAPAKDSFAAGQPNGNYFDAYVNQVWQYYSSNSLVLNMWGNSRQFIGKVQGSQLVFSETDLHNGAFVGGNYIVNKPTTQDILQGSGALATGNSTELAIEAQICAAFNRHVMEDVTKWATPDAWYAASPSNEYARFFHDHGISGLAYGFAYDDVSDASSTVVAAQPEHMVLGIGF